MSAPAFLEQLSPAWFHSSTVLVERGRGVELFDTSGARYLDFTSGIGVTATGHCHPTVVGAIREQAERLLFAQINCVIGKATVDYARELAEVTPPGLDRFFFANSGSEAVEAAVKLCRRATGRPLILVFHGGFHGRSAMTMSLTTSKVGVRAGYQPLPSGVVVAPFPHLHYYARHYGWSEQQTLDFCLGELERLLHTQAAPGEIAAVLLEPVLGEGGYVPAPDAFLVQLAERCRRHELLLVVDEVQSGFGRTGSFWAVDQAGVVPDVLVMAKGMASGLPLSGIATREDLMRRWQPGQHGGTYGGGSAIAMAAARATLRVLADEGLVTRAAQRGERLRAGLLRLQARFGDLVTDVRGRGLMQALELEQAGQPASLLVSRVLAEGVARGLLLLACGPHGNVIRLVPPLVVEDAQLDEGLAILEQALSAALAGMPAGGAV